MSKNAVIIKFSQMMKELEGHYTHFRYKVYLDIDGTLKLNDFGDFGFALQKDLKIIPVEKNEKSKEYTQLIEERLKNKFLEDEFNQLKEMHKDLIYKCIILIKYLNLF